MTNNQTFFSALQTFVDWLEGKRQDLPEDVIERLPENTLVTMFSKHPEYVKLANKFLNDKEVLQVIDKKDLCLFLKDVYRKLNIHRSQIYPLFKLNKKDEYEGLRKPPFVKDYELPLIKDYLVDETQYRRAKRMHLTYSDVVKAIPRKQERRECCQCSLANQPQVLFDTNNPKNVANVDILFVAEAPGQTEVEKGKPLIGRSGQIIRKFIPRFLSDLRWFMTNVCLCRPPDNRTPTKDEVNCCSSLLDTVIDLVRPKLIVALGSTAMERLGVDIKQGVISKRKTLHTYNLNGVTYPVFCTVHPSYVLRNNDESIYEEDFLALRNTYESLVSQTKGRPKSSKYITVEDNVGFFNIVKEEYGLVDIQCHDNYVWYILKDKQGRKTFVKIPVSENYFYYTQKRNDEYILHATEAVFSLGKPFTQDGITLYESDIPLTLRHSVDYFTQVSDNSVDLNVMYLDIEVATENREFALQNGKAKYPVSIISFRTTSGLRKSLVNTKRQGPTELEGYEVEYGTEKEIIRKFMQYLRDVDIVTAWNISFDLPYIILRCEKNCQLSFRHASPLNLRPYIDLNKNVVRIPGLVVLDLLTLYRVLTYGNREFYSLAYIAKLELGEEKLEKGEYFGEIFRTDLVRALRYNIDDVEKIYKLDKKLGIIDYFNELRNIACVPWQDVTTTSKIVEGNILSHCKKQRLIVRNYYKPVTSDNISLPKFGGYVKTPGKGIKKNIYVADFKSLYPSIIMTFNVGLDTLVAKFSNLWNDVIDYLMDKDKVYTLIISPHLNPHKQNYTLQELKSFLQDKIVTPYGTIFYKHSTKEAVNNAILTSLITRRDYHKRLMKSAKDPSEKQEHNNKQRALKEIANSIYGYFGFEGSRFYNKDMVNTITVTGQFMTKTSAYLAQLIYDGKSVTDELTVRDVAYKVMTQYWIDPDTKEVKDIELPNLQYIDTDSVFFKLDDDLTVEQVKELGDKIFSVLNRTVFPNYYSKLFGFEPDHCRFLLEYECVCKGYWLGIKKRYVIRDLVTGDLTVKGLEIRRSDYPVLTKQRLAQLVDLILDEASYNEIKDFVDKTTNEFRTRAEEIDPSVLKSVSYGSNYKKIPSHVVAMMLWNILNNRVDFRVGNKGYLLPIKFNETLLDSKMKEKISNLRKSTGFKGKLNYLAFPEDFPVEQVRELLREFSMLGVITVDTETIVDFGWTQRYKLLLEGIVSQERSKDDTDKLAIFDF